MQILGLGVLNTKIINGAWENAETLAALNPKEKIAIQQFIAGKVALVPMSMDIAWGEIVDVSVNAVNIDLTGTNSDITASLTEAIDYGITNSVDVVIVGYELITLFNNLIEEKHMFVNGNEDDYGELPNTGMKGNKLIKETEHRSGLLVNAVDYSHLIYTFSPHWFGYEVTRYGDPSGDKATLKAEKLVWKNVNADQRVVILNTGTDADSGELFVSFMNEDMKIVYMNFLTFLANHDVDINQ